jgi:membrane protein implicated in regulation of membrane protease activity
MRKRLIVLGLLALGALLIVPAAFASAAYDLSSVSTGFTAQIANAVTTALPIAGPVVALFVGWRVFKRLSHG